MPSVAWQSTLLTLSWQDFKLHTLWSFPFLQHKEFMVMAFDHFVLRKGEAKSTILSGHTHILQQTHTVTVLLHDWENKQHTLHFLRENDNMHNISCVLVLALSHAADPIQSWWAGPLWSKNKYEEPYKPYYISKHSSSVTVQHPNNENLIKDAADLKKIGRGMKLTKQSIRGKSLGDKSLHWRRHNQTEEITKKHGQTKIYTEEATECNNK